MDAKKYNKPPMTIDFTEFVKIEEETEEHTQDKIDDLLNNHITYSPKGLTGRENSR